jgi:hypothetical protein
VVYSKETPATGPMIIEKAKSFYDEMKITKKCTFPGGSNKEFCVN